MFSISMSSLCIHLHTRPHGAQNNTILSKVAYKRSYGVILYYSDCYVLSHYYKSQEKTNSNNVFVHVSILSGYSTKSVIWFLKDLQVSQTHLYKKKQRCTKIK